MKVTRRETRTMLVLSRPITVSVLPPRTCRHCRGRRHGLLSSIYPIFVLLPPSYIPLSSLRLPLCFLFCHPSSIFSTSLFPILTLRNAFKPVKLLFFTIKCVAFLIIGTCTEGTGHSCNFNFFGGSHAMGICWFE